MVRQRPLEPPFDGSIPSSPASFMNRLKIALLGSIPKGDKERSNSIDWKIEYIEKIRVAIPQAQFLYGDLISDSVGPELVVGHDL